MMKEATVYRSTFLVIHCPYEDCRHVTYLDEQDDYGEGYIPDGGREMRCPECKRMMRVVNGY